MEKCSTPISPNAGLYNLWHYRERMPHAVYDAGRRSCQSSHTRSHGLSEVALVPHTANIEVSGSGMWRHRHLCWWRRCLCWRRRYLCWRPGYLCWRSIYQWFCTAESCRMGCVGWCLAMAQPSQVLGGVVRVRGRPNGLTNHPRGDVDRGLLMHAGLLLFVVCCRRLAGRSFWTNRAQAPGQLVLSPTRLPATELS